MSQGIACQKELPGGENASRFWRKCSKMIPLENLEWVGLTYMSDWCVFVHGGYLPWEKGQIANSSDRKKLARHPGKCASQWSDRAQSSSKVPQKQWQNTWHRWWLNQPICEIFVKLEIFPNFRGENKNIWNHHRSAGVYMGGEHSPRLSRWKFIEKLVFHGCRWFLSLIFMVNVSKYQIQGWYGNVLNEFLQTSNYQLTTTAWYRIITF